MKLLVSSFLFSIIAIGLQLTSQTGVETEGTSSRGNFEISGDNGQSRAIQFDAKLATDGHTTGQIIFRDTGSPIPASPKPENTESGDSTQPFYARAECDCLIVEGVEAVMGGVIKESSRKNLIGQRVLLVVQDGDSLTPPLRDKLTFGFYKTTPKLWLETDGERENQGPPPTWVATDAERTDEIGTLNQKSSEVTCETFPLSSHSFVGAKNGKGKIVVTR